MGNSCRNSLIVAFTTFSAFSLFGCGDEPEPNQAPPPAPATQAAVAPPAATPPAAAPAAQPAVAPPAASPEVVSYHATLEEGIDFRKPGYPDFISEVSGVSGLEGWGRWTDGKTVTFKFKDPLPKKFTLLVEAGAYEDNQGKPIKFRVGPIEKECIFKGDTNSPRVATLHFNSSEPGNTLVITIPAPKKPANEERSLGIGLITMKVDTSGKL